jgi:hypothetical protein
MKKQLSKMEMRSPFSILDESARLIRERGKQYGDFNESFKTNAKGLEFIFKRPIKAYQSPIVLAITKLTRLLHDPTNRDSWVDLIAYLAMAASMALSQKNQKDDT